MITKMSTVIVFSASLFVSLSAHAGKSVWDTNWGMDTSTIDSLVQNYINAHGISGNGISVAVAKDDRLVFAKGYGSTRRTDGYPSQVNAANLFRIASVSKAITGTAIMKIWEEGEFNNGLDTLIFGDSSNDQTIFNDIYEPTSGYGANVEDVSLAHLLEMTQGGWTGYCDGGDPMFYDYWGKDHDELISYAIENTGVGNNTYYLNEFENRSCYSNFSYCLLGRVIEDVTSYSYEDYVKEEMLRAVGINDMHISENTNLRFNEVNYNGAGNNNFKRFDSHGGWISSAKDLVKFGVMTENNTFISNNTWNRMLTCDTPGCGNYKKGWDRKPENGTGLDLIGRSGGFGGTRAFLRIHEVNGSMYVAAVIQNVYTGAPWDLADDIVHSTTDWPSYNMFEWNGALVASTLTAVL